ncbi:uncharacterized protein N7515_001212 [Penicillium bovifimosum]|uniref:Uncharacterized protein n=1 Tax=Penicillium bovifimosum TaxID=126998 RepID=A0A9W9LC99_9EURO|nr:uncharacterized protein N7515_001212 [Penicillium bovifimosum]KAJ5146648.1 hypothetical protein N7515_001212 [Penicillium bovifimosum]
MAFPNWLRIILSALTVLSLYPQIQCIRSRKDSSGISVYYVLFNLIAATEQFTIVVFFLVNNNIGGGEVFVHSPSSTGDWLNLGQMTVSYVLFLIFFAFTLHYLPDDVAHKLTALAVYSAFLFVSVFPELYYVITGGIYDNGPYRELPLSLFGGYHLIFVNPVVTLFMVISIIFQVRQTLQEPSSFMSVSVFAFQAFVFALLGVSWLLRIRWPPSGMPAFYRSPVLEMYRLVGWAAMDHLVYALWQALLCFIVWRRGVNSAQSPGGETEPLLAE